MREQYAHVLLEYEPLYTSFLQQRKNKSKEQLAAEQVGPSRKRKRGRAKGKSVEAVVVGKIREPLEEDFKEESESMGDDLDDLPSLLDKKRAKKKKIVSGVASPHLRPVITEATSSEQKKQRLLGSGSGADVLKEKEAPKKIVPEGNVSEKEASPPAPYVFSPQVRWDSPCLPRTGVRENRRLGLPMMQGLSYPKI